MTDGKYYVMEHMDAGKWVLIPQWDGTSYYYARPSLSELVTEAAGSYCRIGRPHRILEYKFDDGGDFVSAVVYEIPIARRMGLFRALWSIISGVL